MKRAGTIPAVVACLYLALAAGAMAHGHDRKPQQRFEGDRRDAAPAHQEKVRENEQRREKDCKQGDRDKAQQAAQPC